MNFFLFSFFFRAADSTLRKDLLSILQNNSINYPLLSSKLKQAAHMKEAFIEIRALLKLTKACEQLRDGRLRISPLICETSLLVLLVLFSTTDTTLFVCFPVNGSAASRDE